MHPRFRRRTSRSASTAVLGIVFVLLRTFEQLADTFVTAILPFYALGVASIFVFRKRGYDPPFRTPLYPVGADPVRAGDALSARQRADRREQPWPTLAIFGIIALGVPVYYLTVGRPPAAAREAGSGKREAGVAAVRGAALPLPRLRLLSARRRDLLASLASRYQTRQQRDSRERDRSRRKDPRIVGRRVEQERRHHSTRE